MNRICTCSQHRDGHWLDQMLGPDFKSFEVVALGSKSNRFAIPKLERDWIVVSFAARLLGFTKSIHTAFIFYIYKLLC